MSLAHERPYRQCPKTGDFLRYPVLDGYAPSGFAEWLLVEAARLGAVVALFGWIVAMLLAVTP